MLRDALDGLALLVLRSLLWLCVLAPSFAQGPPPFPPQLDSDGDGIRDSIDNCPSVPNPNQADFDGDGTGDACDGCPTDPLKIAPGWCGCGVSDADNDGDGLPDCDIDKCPNDPLKTSPGICGCGIPDTDSDGDGVPDCVDLCANDPLKIVPGACGCGAPDTDSDGDGVADCIDNCASIANPQQQDCNADQIGDACELAAGAPDCNLNGVPDACDIAHGTSQDTNQNTIPDECESGGAYPFCSGDGTAATACPCGNTGASGHGCANSTNALGAQLAASGTIVPDSLVLTSSGELASSFSILLQGDIVLGNPVVFGDGLRCVGGSLKRLFNGNAVGGTIAYPPAGFTISGQSATLGDPIAPGSARSYQVYYRDPNLNFCANPPGNSWNVGNAQRVVW